MKRRGLFTLCIILLILVAIPLWLISPILGKEVELTDREYFIAHAGGEVEGIKYTNSREALQKSLSLGYKYVEFDLRLTSDSFIVCCHNFVDFNKSTHCKPDDLHLIPTKEEFLQKKMYDKYTTMSLEDILDIKKSSPFVLVTDKTSDPNLLNQYFPPSIRNTIMVEAFSTSDYVNLKKDGYMAMLSMEALSLRGEHGIARFYHLQKQIGQKIDWVTLDAHRCNFKILRLFKRIFGIKIAMYTSNSKTFFKQHLGKEVDLVYTDSWNFQSLSN